jgi:RNA polymerase sigma-70 factor (ECF subfamily)
VDSAAAETIVAKPEDLELVQRILAGDERAFAQLIDAHHASMERLARVYVHSADVASEVVQETWMAVLTGLQRFEGRSALKTWIFRILTNKAKTRGVREGRTVPFSSLGREDDDREPAVEADRFTSRGKWADPPTGWGHDSPEAILQRKDSMQALRAAIDTLPASQRAVVTMRDVDGWESEDVCNVLEISETNQRVLLHRGRTKLRKALEQLYRGE